MRAPRTSVCRQKCIALVKYGWRTGDEKTKDEGFSQGQGFAIVFRDGSSRDDEDPGWKSCMVTTISLHDFFPPTPPFWFFHLAPLLGTSFWYGFFPLSVQFDCFRILRFELVCKPVPNLVPRFCANSYPFLVGSI